MPRTRAPDLFAEIADLRARGEPAALATVIATRGSVPARDAMKMLVLADGRTRGTVGGGATEDAIRRLALESIATEECRRGTFEISAEAADDTEMICGGALEVFVEPLTVPTCWLFGAGHLATAVAPIAAVAGFRVVVCDDRRSHATAARFPDAAEILARPFPSLLAQVAPRLGASSYCVVVTRSHRLDEQCAEACLRSDARYVGMIGSANKVARCKAYLASRDLAPRTIRRLRAPIGIDLGARTHGEIAVAIVAEMVRTRRVEIPKRAAREPRRTKRVRG
jgi:xanthine dehydrogenase accessory factor